MNDKDTTEVIAYKAFDENLKCRDFQYEVGKTYTHDGEVIACSSGFHSCTNPLDVLNYYELTSSRFTVVKAGGQIAKHGDDTKIASATITIQAELKLPEFIKSAVTWLLDACKTDGNVLAASGDYSKLAASGDSSKLAASGYSSKLAASGDYSQLAASGDYSQLAASGASSIAMASGVNSRAKAGENGAIAMARWVEAEKRYRISVAYVGEDGIKPDVWYELDEAGAFVECNEE